jgi:hypothetical protein
MGCTSAQYMLGLCFDQGCGTEHNLRDAVQPGPPLSTGVPLTPRYPVAVPIVPVVTCTASSSRGAQHPCSLSSPRRAQIGPCSSPRCMCACARTAAAPPCAVRHWRKSAPELPRITRTSKRACGRELEARFCITQVKWYLKAAQQGHVEAMFSVGMCFESVGAASVTALGWQGEGSKSDIQGARDLAVIWLTPLPSPPHPLSPRAHTPASAYRLQQDWTLIRWCFRYRNAAEAGHHGAQSNLGRCYKYGEGLTRDLRSQAEGTRLMPISKRDAHRGHAERIASISRERVLELVLIPQKKAAKQLGICLTTFKKIYRRHVTPTP